MAVTPEIIQASWEASGGNSLLRGFRNFQELFDSIPGRERLLQTVNGGGLFLVCIDERLIGGSALTPESRNYVRMAGEGILNPYATKDMKEAALSGVIVHIDCGAKGLYAVGREGHPDDIGIEAVIISAGAAGIPVLGTITPDSFRSPFHDARVVYYDGTGRLDWSRIEGCTLPPGFIVTRLIISDPSYAQTEVSVAVNIAQGHHGYGSRFTDGSPLYLVGVTDNQPGSIKADMLIQELREVAVKKHAVAVDLIVAK